MSKIITFSRFFPKLHARAGKPTHFVEKIWVSLGKKFIQDGEKNDLPNECRNFLTQTFSPKFHTIRKGHRWKVGDKFSPRIWSGKPYQSKQITIAPDIEIKKVWKIEITSSFLGLGYEDSILIDEQPILMGRCETLAQNDGLSVADFKSWFDLDKKLIVNFQGQIICWNENINYG